MSTENGCILFYSTTETPGKMTPQTEAESRAGLNRPPCRPLGQLGGAQAGVLGRIKDFDILDITVDEDSTHALSTLLVVTAGSDGSLRIWTVDPKELIEFVKPETGIEVIEGTYESRPIGRMLGMYETHNRITCLKSFVLNSSLDKSELQHLTGEIASGSYGREEDDNINDVNDSV